MTFDAWMTLGVLAIVVATLATNRIGIDVVMAGGLTLLLLLGVLDIEQAAAGFGSPAVLILAGLFVVAAGLDRTGAIRMAAGKLLGKPTGVRSAQFRLMVPVALFSGVMNNTPIVAIGVPIVRDWARHLRMSPSALFMPLSFAAILGAKLTVIGSASNLIVMEEFLGWSENAGDAAATYSPAWVFFGIAGVGLPVCIVGILFIGFTAKKLLPERRPAEDFSQDGRQYRTQLVVSDDAPFIGKTIEEAELRNLPGLFLSEIERAARDWKYRTQLVVSDDSPFIGKTIQEAGLQQTASFFLSEIERERQLKDPKDRNNAGMKNRKCDKCGCYAFPLWEGVACGEELWNLCDDCSRIISPVSTVEKLQRGDVLSFVGTLDSFNRHRKGFAVIAGQPWKVDTSAVEKLVAVSPNEKLQGGDVLTFVGALESVMDLRKLRGLDVADEQTEKMDSSATQRRMVECVISMNSPLVDRSIRDARFRTRYAAVVTAVHRQGQQVAGKIGDITLRPGDTLLLETHQNFAQLWHDSDEFYLVSELEGERPVRHNRAAASLVILAVMVVLLATGVVDRVAAVWACGLAMIVTRCLSGTEARRAVNWQILIVVAASLGIAAAVQSTGLATRAVELITPGEGASLMGMLFVLFLLAAAAGQLVTPYGAAVLLFPFTMQLAASAGADPVPFVFTLMVAVGCPFINPVGYQTNLMVFGPGGYRFSDFARVGLPLTLILAVVTAVLAPMVYG